MMRRLLTRLFIGPALLAGSVGLIQSEPSDPPQPQDGIRNVILISLDTVRWDVVSAYNAPEVNTPNIGAVAREGMVFEYAFAPMPITLPSHASMLTGLNPPVHGVLDNGRYALAPHHVTLAERLKSNGFNTAAFVSALVLDSDYGLDQGFDHYDDEIPESEVIGERRGDATTSKAIDWIRHHKNERNFVFLHLFDPHAPYEAPESFNSKIKSRYKDFPPFIQDYVAEVAFVDHCIGVLIEELKDLGLYDSSLICITSDHGESHGEHGENTHGFYIYTSTMRVPMIIKAPGFDLPSRFRSPMGIVDISPTICGFLGMEKLQKIQGIDHSKNLPKMNEKKPGRSIFMMSIEPMKYGGKTLFGSVERNFHYIDSGRPELYDFISDTYEKKNLAIQKKDTVNEKRKMLSSILDSMPPVVRSENRSIDAETRDRLEALGYVASPAGEAQPGIEARDLIEYHKLNLVALTYLSPENRARALSACDEMIRLRPDFPLGYEMKGRVLASVGRDDEAGRYFQKADSLGRSGVN